MMNKIVILVPCFFLLFAQSVNSQHYNYTQYTVNDGLPTNYVYGAVEDDEGYMWIYTELGVAKFNGYEYINYSIEDGLPVNDIFIMLKAADGKLWMNGYFSNPAYVENDSIHQFKIDSINSNAFLLSVGNKITYTKNYFKWVEDLDGLEKNLVGDGLLETILLKDHYMKWAILPENDFFTFSYESGIFSRYEDLNKIEEFKLEKKLNYSDGHNWCQLVSTKNPYYLFVNLDGVLIVDALDKQERYMNWKDYFENKVIFTAIATHGEEIFISTNLGLLIIDKNKNILTYAFPELADKYTLLRSFKDSRGNIWLGTKEAGLFFFSEQQLKSKLIKSSVENDASFERIVRLTNDEILSVTDKGSIFNVRTGKFEHLNIGLNNLNDIHLTNKDELIVCTSSLTSFTYGNGNISSLDMAINPKLLQKPIIPSSTDLMLSLNTNVKNIFLFSEDELFVNSIYGLHKLYLAKGGLAEIEKLANGIKFVTGRASKNQIYFSNNQKLFSYNSMLGVQEILSLPLISSIEFLDDHRMLIGTESSGTFEYNTADSSLLNIGNFGSVSKMLAVDHLNFYLASNRGIRQLSKSDGAWEVLNHWGLDHGLPTLEVNDFIIDENKLYVCTNEGIAIINSKIESAVAVKSSKLEVKSVSNADDDIQLGAKLSNRQNDIEFNYQLLDFKSAGNITYQYKLSPIQKEWKKTSDRNAIFNNLTPNDYSFSLEAFDINNTRYVLEDSFDFKIKKTFLANSAFCNFFLYLIDDFNLLVRKFQQKSNAKRD